MDPSRDHPVALQHAAPRTIAAVHARLPIRDGPRVFARYLDQVYAAARSGSLQLDGQNVFVYRGAPGRRARGAPSSGAGTRPPSDPTANVQPTIVPGGSVATTTPRGSYAQLGAAHTAVIEWCRARGY